MEIRTIAVIAHVDHGKTTITDNILQQTGAKEASGASMDSFALELERGITIYAKNASFTYKDTRINIVDTPGHADFGSEVERVMRAVDGVLLIVDAQEGPMPQTRFVLRKALELGLQPIVVINKIDKPAAEPARVHDEVLELLLELGANDKQLDCTFLYAIGRAGIAKLSLDQESTNLNPLLDTILKDFPPTVVLPEHESGVMQVFNLGYDNFLGRLALCRVYGGSFKPGQTVYLTSNAVTAKKFQLTKIFSFIGQKRVEASEAVAGDIVLVAGIPEVTIGDTIAATPEHLAMPSITVDEPTISLRFLVNDSPFGGREGQFVTTRQIKERLERELEVNVGLKVDFTGDSYVVSGRGELHIAILLETMRREGFEIQVSQPKVIIKEIDGKKQEPYEELVVDVPEEFQSKVIEKLSMRKGMITSMKPLQGNHFRLLFEIPTRGFLGYRNQFVIDTRGEGILSSRFIGFKDYAGQIDKHITGAMISMEAGKALAFSLDNLQQRGTLFIGPAEEVYEGMVIGDVTKGEDLYVNPTKGKQLTNMRASGSDDAIMLVPPVRLSIERAMEIMREDEYVEITPKAVRLRKIYRNKSERDRAERQTAKAEAK